jgi:hypothetical protein
MAPDLMFEGAPQLWRADPLELRGTTAPGLDLEQGEGDVTCDLGGRWKMWPGRSSRLDPLRLDRFLCPPLPLV